MTRKDAFVEGEYYHVFLRGNMKQEIFFNDSDRWRFLTLMFLLQSLSEISSDISVLTKAFKNRFSAVAKKDTCNELNDLIASAEDLRKVEVCCYTLMPNHFHFLLGCVKDGSISKYMQRLLNSYTKYVNKKYERTGHLFQSSFGSKLIEDNDQLLYLSTYIHRNIREYPKWKNKEVDYQWSSFQDYVKKNRWGALLCTDPILGQFDNKDELLSYTNESVAKDSDFA